MLLYKYKRNSIKFKQFDFLESYYQPCALPLSLPGSAPRYPQISHARAAFSNEDLLRGGSAASHVSGVLTIVLICIENGHNCILHFLTYCNNVLV